MLERHDGQPWHLRYEGMAGGSAGRWVGVCAAALAVVLASSGRSRLGVCTVSRCDRVYVDTSHNGTRRYWRRPALTAERFIPDPFATEPGARLNVTGDLVCELPRLPTQGRLDRHRPAPTRTR